MRLCWIALCLVIPLLSQTTPSDGTGMDKDDLLQLLVKQFKHRTRSNSTGLTKDDLQLLVEDPKHRTRSNGTGLTMDDLVWLLAADFKRQQIVAEDVLELDASFSHQIKKNGQEQTKHQHIHPFTHTVMSGLPHTLGNNTSTHPLAEGFYIWSCAVPKPRGHASLLVITNVNMEVLTQKSIMGFRTWAPKMINSTALFVLATKGDTQEAYKGGSHGIVWNIATGATRFVAVGACSHDLDYDERADTWIAIIAQAVKMHCGPRHPTFLCPSRNLVRVDFDTVVEQASNGSVLWQWDARKFLVDWTRLHGPLYLSGDSVKPGGNRTVFTDLTHLNGVFLDHATGLVYANSRHLDTVFAIERGTGTLRWSCGRFGTVPSFRGQSSVVSLFSRSHIFYPAGNNHFYTFNNNLLELAGDKYQYRNPKNSSVQPLRRDADGMREVATFTGPRRIIGGGLTLLPRGGFLTLFGDGRQTVMEGTWDGRIHHTGTVQKMFMYFPAKVFDRPQLHVTLDRTANASGPPRAAHVCVWDTYLRRRPGTGMLTTSSTDAACAGLCRENPGYPFRREIVLKAHWEESCTFLSIPYGGFAVHLENVDGLTIRVHVPRPCACPSHPVPI